MVLSVSGLTIVFNGVQPFIAVNNISFSIDKGKTLAIVGESGSGKSLTALALMGLLPKSATLKGELLLTTNKMDSQLTAILGGAEGHDLRFIRGKEISMVFQEPMSSLNPVMKVGLQLEEAIRCHQNISRNAAMRLSIEWLGKVLLPDPEKIYHRYPHQLSGGQKQRVMIAIAMCNHPALLVADEPTTALDVTVQQEIIQLMSYLQQEHQTAMIFITHDLQLAATIADDVLVMYKGEIVEYGAAQQVLEHPQHAYTRALIACKPSAAHKGHRLPVVAGFMDNKIRETEQVQYKNIIEGTALLEVKNVQIWFTDSKSIMGKPSSYIKAVDDVSFILKKGETLGLVGESGCGKSTLSRGIAGLLPVHGGEILFKGSDLTRLSPKEWRGMRRHIQMVFQDPYSSLNPRMTIYDMLAEPLMVHGIVPGNELVKETKRLLDLVQLPADSLNRYPHQFSGGQRQRIGIARALALRPQLLICDESVSALDVSIQAQILNLLKDLQQELQLTYLFISHDLSVVHYISDRVMVMHAGKIVEHGTAEQVLKQPVDEYTKRLIEAMPG